MTLRYSKHALEELQRRSIPRTVADLVAGRPEQVVNDESRLVVYQSRVTINGKEYLLRLFIVQADGDNVVVTVYRTSKISKYWVNP